MAKEPLERDARHGDAPPDGMAEDLRPPAVSPTLYDEHYYLNWCAGFEAWRESEGAEFAPLYAGALDLAELAAQETLVDIGTGRGELLVAAAERGAERAIGIEYSPAAVELATRTIRSHGASPVAEVVLADARSLPLAADQANLVTMLDVVEHLAPPELDRALGEARRVLKPGGRIFVHTMPNRLIYSVTYRLQRTLVPWRLFSWPKEPRVALEREMHVNEQTTGSLRRALRRAGFEGIEVGTGRWIHDQFVPVDRARRLYRRLAAHRLTAMFGAADIWARARKKGESTIA
ncbi:MAG: methyltransferase domain-containing protein [Solirubrobacterales bacterium]